MPAEVVDSSASSPRRMSRKASKVGPGGNVKANCFVSCIVRQPCLFLVLFSFIAVFCLWYIVMNCPASNAKGGPLKSPFDSTVDDMCMGMEYFPSRGGDNNPDDVRTQRQTALSELRKSQTFGRGAPKSDDSLLSATDATPSTNADSAPPASAIASALGSGKLPQYDVLQRRPVGASGLLSEKDAVQEDERSQAAHFLWIMYLGRQPEGSDEKTAPRSNVLTRDSLKLIHEIEDRVANIKSKDGYTFGKKDEVKDQKLTWDDFCWQLTFETDPCFTCRKRVACQGPMSLNNMLYPTTNVDININRTGYKSWGISAETFYGTGPFSQCLATWGYFDRSKAMPIQPIVDGAAGAAYYNKNYSSCYQFAGGYGGGHCSGYSIGSQWDIPSSYIAAQYYAGAPNATLTGCTINNGKGKDILTEDEQKAAFEDLFEWKYDSDADKSDWYLKPAYNFYFDPKFAKDNLKSGATRSQMFVGGPLKGYDNREDQGRQQEQVYEAFFKNDVDPVLSEYADSRSDGVNPKTKDHFEFLYFSSPLFFPVFLEILARDGSLAFGSVIFVQLYLWFHTKSFMLAAAGMGHILMSFPVALFAMVAIVGFRYFGFFCFLSVYIILAIGADDIFVFIDAWKQSFQEEGLLGTPLAVRMSWVWTRAARAMAVTSLTTFAAFCAAASSVLLGTQSFGVFTAFLVAANYLFVCTWFPCWVILWYKYIDSQYPDSCDCCCFTCCVAETKQRFVCCPCPCSICRDCCCCKHDTEPKPRSTVTVQTIENPETAKSDAEEDHVAAQRSIEYFFEHIYAPYLLGTPIPCLKKVKGAHINLFLFFIITVLAIWKGKDIAPASKNSEFLPKWHPMQKFFTYWSGEDSPFRESDNDEMVRVTYVFGLDGSKPIEADPDRFNSDIEGELRYDDKFDLVSESAQQHYIDTCEKLRTGDGYNGKLTRQNKLDPQSAECHCFLNDAVDYYNDLSGEETPGNNKTLPTDPAEFRRVLNDFFETSDGRKRASQVGLDRSKDDKPYFATIVCNSSVLDTWAPYVMFEPYEAAQDKFVETTNKECEVDGMKSMFQTAGMWVRNATQRTYLSDAVYGILMSLGLAFVILFLSTANIVVAVLSLMNIAGIIACILAMMVLLGWELGSIESICLTILVGLSVDYVVHLANCYMEAPFSDRQRRVTSALGEMGVTVLGGAITSLGASSMLFACYVQFFLKFGGFMFFTIGFSLLWSMGWFMAIMSVVGPEGNKGSIVCLRKLLGHKVDAADAEASEQSGDL